MTKALPLFGRDYTWISLVFPLPLVKANTSVVHDVGCILGDLQMREFLKSKWLRVPIRRKYVKNKIPKVWEEKINF